MAGTSGIMYITYLEKHGSFIKIWGHVDRNYPTVLEKSLKQMALQFDVGLFIPQIESIQVGVLCCAKYKDGCYYRARITNTIMLQQSVVEVHFIDYGNRDIVPIMNLRTIGSFAPGLISIQAQAKDFIFANVTHPGVGWDHSTIQTVSNEIKNTEVHWLITGQAGNYTTVKLFKNGEDYALNLFNRGLVLSIATPAQNMILQNTAGGAAVSPFQVTPPPIPPALITSTTPPMSQIQQQPVVSTTPTALLTYKASSIEAGSEHKVYVSYVSDGPCQFSVQLKRLEDNLARLMKELNEMSLHPLEDDPLPGTVCVARCLEDDHICRAVVTSMVDSQFKVFYVDFGNTEVVPIDNLYQIPFKYVIPKVMAMRYALAGLDRSSVTLEMKCAFKEFVSDKLLRMRSHPAPARSALPLCTLWDSNNVNVLEVLQRAALLAYPEPVQLTRGFSQEVRVSYVHSCSHFYVQLKMKEEELRKLMAELQENCPNADGLQASQIKLGLPCCVPFETDGQWYRAQIINVENDNVKVRYVDYGNEDIVPINSLRMPRGELLTALRPQALECCLDGYQNMADDLQRDNILEELILEKEFTMKVIEMQGSRALVQLNDQSRYNVGSLLLEKLAVACSQVSPILIQDSHHIEQRKRKSPTFNHASQNYRLDRKPLRDHNAKETSNDNGWTSPKQTSNDKGWNNKQDSNERGWGKKQDSSERGWGNKQESNDQGWDNKQDSNDRGWGNKQDSWRSSKPPRKDSETSERSKGDNFEKGRGRRDGLKTDNWESNEPHWKKNNNTQNRSKRREGSEKSWSDGSEKNWRRKSDDKRPSFRQDGGGRKGGAFRSSTQDNTWGGSSNNVPAAVAKVLDPASNTATFITSNLDGRSEKALISWFHDPSNFFCQLQESQTEFRTMMEDIQNTYCKIKSESVPVGAPAIALFPDDGVRYRVCVMEAMGLKYRVQYVDFGNVSTTDQVWPIEKKFMQLPAQAISCGLNGLAAPEGGWLNPDSYSTYFDKDCFTCTFISSENNKYLVDLTCDEQNVSESLISAGLASYAYYRPEFDPTILLGQQIQVTLGEVESLSSFNLHLQNEILLHSTMHNLESVTETFEDTLKQYIGSNVIMYVDNVLEKTEVTLYDTNGTKLKIVEPDEGAFETVDALCPFPVFYSSFSGWVSHIVPSEDEKCTVFIQSSEFADTLAQLLEDLFNHYDATTLDTPLKPEVDVLYGIHSSDGNWYRGRVTNVEEETAAVTFVDYGNSETVANTELRELAAEFVQQHMLALEVATTGVDQTFTEEEITANVWYGETGWEAEILKGGQPVAPTQTEIAPEEETVLSAVTEQLDQPSETQAAVDAAPVEKPKTDQVNQIGVSVILSHVDNLSEFYLQLSEELPTIDTLQATLQEQAESLPVLENPVAGVLCAAPYSLDQEWYRAQVLDADSDITTVRFVDYGNTDVLSNDTTQVKTLPPELLSLERHARRCSLILKPLESEWSLTACERFEILTKSADLTAEILHQDEKTTYVQLYANGQNVADTLLQEGVAVKLQLETESSCTGYVSHLNSPSEFWIQLENSVADLEWIAEQLSNAASFPELEDLTPGSLCAALFPDDEMWYRARILSNTVAGLEVLFIDYGNSCTCSGLRQLPEDLIMLPALAQKCSLQRPPGILQWSTEVTDKFKGISADGVSIFTIDKLTTGETTVVRLLLEGKDVATQLLPATEDAYISHYESLFSFWVQKTTNQPKLVSITEKLEQAESWPKYEEKEGCNLIAALFDEDKTWYRAKILSEKDSAFEVLFVDFGNTSVASELRLLPSDIVEESPLATKCKLDPLPGFRWNDESSKQLAVINNEGNTLFQVEFVSADVVRLYLNGNDIRSDLDSISVSSTQSTPKKGFTMKTDSLPQDIEKLLNSDSELIIGKTKTDDVGTEAEQISEDANVLENEQGTQADNSELLTGEDKKTDDVLGYEEVENQQDIPGTEGDSDFTMTTESSSSCKLYETCTDSSQFTQKLSDEISISTEVPETGAEKFDENMQENLATVGPSSLTKHNESGSATVITKVETPAEYEPEESKDEMKMVGNTKIEENENGSNVTLEQKVSGIDVDIKNLEHKSDYSEVTNLATEDSVGIENLEHKFDNSEGTELPSEDSVGTENLELKSDYSENTKLPTEDSVDIGNLEHKPGYSEDSKLPTEDSVYIENLKLKSDYSEDTKVPTENSVDIENLEHKSDYSEETNLPTNDSAKDIGLENKHSIEQDLGREDSIEQHSGKENFIVQDLGKGDSINQGTNVTEDIANNSGGDADVLVKSEKLLKGATTDDESLEETNKIEISENLEQPSKDDGSTFIPQRRSSTPHCEKIVPGAICRGDLSEIEKDDHIEKITAIEKLKKAETDEEIETDKHLKGEILLPSVIKTEVLPHTPITSTSKIALDERIVPGCVSRGDTPEPSEKEIDRVLSGAINGLEVNKENALT